MSIDLKQVFTGHSHEVAEKPQSPEEILHVGRRATRSAAKGSAGLSGAGMYPELIGVVIDESDLAQPEYIASDTQERIAAVPSAALVENSADFAQWENQVTPVPPAAYAAQQPQVPNEAIRYESVS